MKWYVVSVSRDAKTWLLLADVVGSGRCMWVRPGRKGGMEFDSKTEAESMMTSRRLATDYCLVVNEEQLIARVLECG